jgi:hypothetical protein
VTSLRTTRGRRPWRVVAGVIVAAGLTAGVVFAALDRPEPIAYYRLVGDRTLVVGTTTATATWTRVSSVTETPTTVVVAVRSFRIQLGPGTAALIPIEFVLTLERPLDGRTVVDASTGAAVRETNCVGPAPCR